MNEQQPFEAIRKSDEAGREYWSARNLGPLLDYKEWRNFYKVIAKAIISCEASVVIPRQTILLKPTKWSN